ncbi:RING/U-box superfamily protein [Prunus dulcis]|uniref:RING/U-box superfamily protein n=1 Tax=Prunus dulcis TaxID=3755 RepID=A0A4Y1QPL2_PRUDU|nr:RING/U-box superfamily protein [Prunus dulcis]
MFQTGRFFSHNRNAKPQALHNTVMDHISSLECLKLDSESEVLDKDSGKNDLFLSAMVPLNYDTPIIGSKVAESEAAELEADASDTDDWDSEELIIGSNADEFEADESEDDEFEADDDEFEANESEDDEFEAKDEFEADDEFEDDEFEADESETDDSETDDSDFEKLIETHVVAFVAKAMDVQF